MRVIKLLAILLAVMTLFSGCRSIGVTSTSSEEWFQKNGSMAFRSNEISNNCRMFLLSRQLSKLYDNDPESAIYCIYQDYRISHDRRYLNVLTELCYVAGMNADNNDKRVAFHCASAYFAYQYLFSKSVHPDLPMPYDMDVFVIARYYNSALDTLIDYLNNKHIIFNKSYNLPAVAGLTLTFEEPLNELPFAIDKTAKILSCYRFSAEGFYVFSYKPGLGVPLIARSENPAPRPKPFKTTNYLSYPLTFFLRMGEAENGTIRARIELYNSLNTDSVKVENKTVPLSVDFTTPLAYDLRNPPIIDGFSFMFKADSPDNYGLFALELEKNKIPLVFVHGLMSNPRTWAQMVNILLDDPDIRRNYQMWLFTYSTGNPVLYSAYLLRKSLLDAKVHFDTPEAAANFNQMFIVSHSMGGLLSKTTIQNTGNQLKDKLVPASAIAKKKLSPEEQQFVMDMLVFEQLSFVKGVIFMATPHKGADMATWVIVRWASSWISLPSYLKEHVSGLRKRITAADDVNSIHVDTGLDSLAPENKMLNALSEVPFSATVPYFTVCGNENAAGVPGGTDGIVPYWSSHLNTAKSELIVQSDHSVQDNAAAIEEVRKILLLHLRTIGRIK
jgi:pimeloyl-ACP methyl ester carboxylesterase